VTVDVDPNATALLIMDYQPATLGFLADPDAFVSPALALADELRAAGGRIVFVRVGFTDADYAKFPGRSIMGGRVKAGRPNLDDDSPSSHLHPRVTAQRHDLVVRKTRVGAFSTTNLHAELAGTGITTLLLAGVQTSGVVLSTVREAHDLDYELIVAADACGDPDDQVHRFLVDQILPRQAHVTTTGVISDAVKVAVANS
jgi:nicotinamidase-related amidase